MNFRNNVLAIVLAAAVAGGLSGCGQVLHNLQPHRLWKLNHGSPGMPADDWNTSRGKPGASAAYLASVSDPVAEAPSQRTAAGQ